MMFALRGRRDKAAFSSGCKPHPANRVSIFNRNGIVTAVKFLFRVTLRRSDLVTAFYHIRQPQAIPPVLSADEIEQLLASAKTLRGRVMLSLAYGCGP